MVFNQDPSPSSDIPYPYDTAITLYVQKSGAQKVEETEEKVTIPSSVKGMLPSEAISTIKGLFKNNAVTLKFEEVFYMATVGGGKFFGNVGSFEKGYEFDALVLNDERLPHPQELSLRQRLERFAYLSGDMIGIAAKYVAGNRIF